MLLYHSFETAEKVAFRWLLFHNAIRLCQCSVFVFFLNYILEELVDTCSIQAVKLIQIFHVFNN